VSKIEWTDQTWNPVTGCTKVSAGCKNCYAERLSERFRGVPGHPYEQGFDLKLWPERLDQPLRWRKPRRVFVNSMSDLFHEDVPDSYIGSVFETMYNAPRHTFQVLTKRPGRMAEFVGGVRRKVFGDWWPLPNVWLGTSVENQATADERIPHLLATPAAVRFLSCEPLLDPLQLAGWLPAGEGIDWVIVGGESGPRARPMELAWVRAIRDQCAAASVPFFMKQITERGRKVPFDEWPEDLKVREWPEGATP